MKINRLFVLSFVFSTLVHFAASFVLEGLAGLGAAAAGFSYASRCAFIECCNDHYVPHNTTELYHQMKELLYGQHIAQDIVYSAIQSHIVNRSPRKPLVLSFHGGAGTGKNYLAGMIARSLFQLGEKSKYYHFFNGRTDFPSDNTDLVYGYKMAIKSKVEQALSNCERSVFVFDEIDKIASGLLDILVPYMDYTSWKQFENKKAIFIFIANTGSGEIVKKMLEFYEKGEKREDIRIEDFERLIEKGAFNEEGGLQKSGAIESKVIDYYVPFLPLQEKHIIRCIKYVFKDRGVTRPSKDQIKNALRHVTYGPSPHDLYSTAGCKQLHHKASSILYRKEFDD